MYDEINDKLCRVCLDNGDIYLYEEESTNLSVKLMSITPIEVIFLISKFKKLIFSLKLITDI